MCRPGSASEAERPVAAAGPLLVLREVTARGPRVFNFVDLAADPQAPPAATAVVCPVDAVTAEVQGIWAGTPAPTEVLLRSLVASLADVLRASGYRRLLVTVRSDDAERLAAVQAGGFSPLADQVACAEGVRLGLTL